MTCDEFKRFLRGHFAMRHGGCIIRVAMDNPTRRLIMARESDHHLESTTRRDANVEALLRDAAFVLKMTRRVKEEMLRDVGSRSKLSCTADRPHFGSAV